MPTDNVFHVINYRCEIMTWHNGNVVGVIDWFLYMQRTPFHSPALGYGTVFRRTWKTLTYPELHTIFLLLTDFVVRCRNKARSAPCLVSFTVYFFLCLTKIKIISGIILIIQSSNFYYVKCTLCHKYAFRYVKCRRICTGSCVRSIPVSLFSLLFTADFVWRRYVTKLA